MSESFHFQVNPGGMLDVLSNHLYKSPDVFLRELLQNGVDAITLRRREQPGWQEGRITIAVEPGRRLVFQDNGAGLDEAGIPRFPAVIGQSFKTELVNGVLPEDYVGRFGIGLLSCFMASDSIVVRTRPMGGGEPHVWTGLPDGTYTLEPLQEENMFAMLEEISPEEQQRADTLLFAANRALAPYDCQAQLRRFLPMDLPALYAMSDEVQFLRQIQSAQDTGGVFSHALSSMLSGVRERPLATLYLNWNSAIVRQTAASPASGLLAAMTRVLYVQALLAGGHPLRGGELKDMNAALPELLQHTAGQ